MLFNPWRSIRSLTAFLLLTFCATGILAQTHVVSQNELHGELVNTGQSRERNIQKVKSMFSSKERKAALEASKISPERVDAAISTLDDEELAKLAARADKLNEDFAAGSISDRDLIYILIGVAVLILIIVAVR